MSWTAVAAVSKDLPVVVTAKDWVKLRERGDAALHRFLIATHEIRLEPVEEFRSWLELKLNEGG